MLDIVHLHNKHFRYVENMLKTTQIFLVMCSNASPDMCTCIDYHLLKQTQSHAEGKFSCKTRQMILVVSAWDSGSRC